MVKGGASDGSNSEGRPNLTKRPHFVPAVYLRAWSDDADQVVVKRRGHADVFTPNVTNVAVEAGIYGAGNIGQGRENLFGQVEDMWLGLRQSLIRSGGHVARLERDAISVFAALQLIRTREHVAQIEFVHRFADFSRRRPVERQDVRTFLAERHLKFDPSEGEVEGAWSHLAYVLKDDNMPTREQMLEISIGIATGKLAPILGKMGWSVEHCQSPKLFTSDRPVMSWRTPSLRDSYEGMGIDTAEEIRFPIGPRDLLVMRPSEQNHGPRVVQSRRFERVNADVALQCHELVVATPSVEGLIRSLPLAPHRPVLRFNMAPGVRRLADGTEEEMGDIIHSWIPARADR